METARARRGIRRFDEIGRMTGGWLACLAKG
jgi:hypothetical protein